MRIKDSHPSPPLPEQTAIAHFLEEQTEKIVAAIAADRRVIELLQEFRTCLVADVVTGKVDVREVAAQLPEEPEEPESLAEPIEAANGEERDESEPDKITTEELEDVADE